MYVVIPFCSAWFLAPSSVEGASFSSGPATRGASPLIPSPASFRGGSSTPDDLGGKVAAPLTLQSSYDPAMFALKKCSTYLSPGKEQYVPTAAVLITHVLPYSGMVYSSMDSFLFHFLIPSPSFYHLFLLLVSSFSLSSSSSSSSSSSFCFSFLSMTRCCLQERLGQVKCWR